MEPVTTSYLVLGIALFVLLNSAALGVYFERRISGFMQNRLGPNRVGPYGILQPLADVIKLLLKEDITPRKGHKTLHSLAPMIPIFTVLLTIAVIPFGAGIVATDIGVGVLYILAAGSLGVYGVTLAGWASNSKYSLLGGLRAAAMMVSYELPMGLAVASCILFAGSLSVVDVAQSQLYWWNVFRNPIGCIIFITAIYAEAHRTPFDVTEAEQELVGGYHTEYGSMKFGMFFMAEYMHIVVASMLITTFFFGSYHLPFAGYWLPQIGTTWKTVLDIVVFSLKTLFFSFLFIWVRWTIPRFKFDQVMRLCWKKLLPLAIVNFAVLAVIVYLWYNVF